MTVIVEVGPRDGLQSEDMVLPMATRLSLIERCAAAGAQRIEAVSFAHPGWVPQMAGAEEICRALPVDRGWSAIGLVLNRRGMDRALATTLDEVNLVAYGSNGYSTKNTGAPAAERNAEVAAMIPDAVSAGKQVTVTISVSFGDPVDGHVPVGQIAEVAAQMVEAGAHEIALGDTIGVGVPSDVTDRVAAVKEAAPGTAVRCHFHDTHRTGYPNVFAAIEAGADAIDASVGGHGGSPFSPGAGGNVATEHLAWMLERSGIDTGLDRDALVAIAAWLDHALLTGEPVA